MGEDKITRFLQSSLESYLMDLHELVSIDSGTHNKRGVDAVATAMEAKLRAHGFEVERLANDTYGDSVIGRMRGKGDRKIVLVGHMDTVYPDGTAERHPFRLEGDCAFGPGTADMKDGILAGLYAMRAIQQSDIDSFGEIVLFLNPDEEIGSPSSADLIDAECQGATAALVLEGALEDGSVVVGRKGVYDYKLTVQGRSAHAGVEPEKGRSAIRELAHKIVAITDLNGLDEGTTVNVGTIEGGTKANVVAESAVCEIDLRVKTLSARDRFERELGRILSEPTVPDTSIDTESRSCFPPMERNNRNERLYSTAKEIAAKLGIELAAAESGGGSDANHISALGVPVLDGLGPIGTGKHNAGEESLLVPSVVERTTLLTHLILELSRSE